MTPAMSVLLVTDVMDSVEGVLTSFRRQTIADRVEIILAAPPGTPIPDDVGAGFASATVVRVDDPYSVAASRAECMHAATAPFVAIGETHCIPEPDWCEKMLAPFSDPAVAVVSPRILCANPRTTLSQAAQLMDYGPWAQGSRGPRRHLPAHNVVYRRDLLLSFGEGLADALDVDSGLSELFLADGHQLLFEPEARAHHLNVSRPLTYLRERVVNGRTYGGHRARPWGAPRRLAYGLAWPLIPVVRFVRLTPIARAAGLHIRAVPTFALALVLASAGEGIGYVFGPGGAPAIRHRMEIERGRHVRRGEASAALARVLAMNEPA